MVTASICTIGDEILIGQIVDTNSSMIAKALNAIGVKVVRMISGADSEEDIFATVEHCARLSDIVIITGGLGPTKDDITKTALAKFTNACGFIQSKEQYEIIEKVLTARGIELSDINRAQAMVPDSCKVILNECGTAPCMEFVMQKENGNQYLIFSMPGVPFETENALPKVIEAVLSVFDADGLRYAFRKFIRAGRCGYNRRGFISRLLYVVFVNLIRNGCVGVQKVSVFGIHPSYGLLRLLHRGKTAVEVLHSGPYRIVYLVHLVLFQLFHETLNFSPVAAGKVPQEPFQIAGNEDVHRRGVCKVELPSRVVDAGIYEIRENLVFIGCADELSYRHSHKLCIIRRQNVSEISGRNNNVHRLAVFDRSQLHQLNVAVYVVCDLRNQPSYVYGICRRKSYTL